MRIGILIGQDAVGNQYDIGEKGAALKLDVDVQRVKDLVDSATVNGLKVEIGKKPVELIRGIMLTQNGLVKRRRFAKAKAAAKAKD
jgi:hypothetical protein